MAKYRVNRLSGWPVAPFAGLSKQINRLTGQLANGLTGQPITFQSSSLHSYRPIFQPRFAVGAPIIGMDLLTMRKFNQARHILLIFFGLFIVPAFCGIAWGHHENIACATCHDKTAEELKEYVHDSTKFPISARCLACHDGSMDVSGLNPPHVINGRTELAGGSFSPTILSSGVGHNILSIDQVQGLTPPGGAALDDFGCLSCHDAHDNGNFRNLKKKINGYETLVEADGDPNYQQNVYISGINNFCGACHERFNRTSNSRGARGWRQHPVGITIAGAQHADFNHWSGLSDRITQAEYPSGNSTDLYGAQVICLSCHRAHASPYKNALRWDYSQNVRGCLECHPF